MRIKIGLVKLSVGYHEKENSKQTGRTSFLKEYFFTRNEAYILYIFTKWSQN